MKGFSWFFFPLGVASILFLSSCGKRSPDEPSRSVSEKNVLLIVVDTLRADFLSCYGSALVKSPNIDRLAVEGALFENAFSHIPITGPSHAAMFTSQFPSDVGVYNNGQVLAATQSCLAETMLESGRTTAGFVSLGVLERRFGFAQGFETYREDLGAAWQANALEINAKVFEWLNGKPPDKPFFAFVHYCDPHEPYYSHGRRETIVELKLGEARLGTIDIAKETLLSFALDLPPGNTEIALGCERKFRFRAVTLEPSGTGARCQPSKGWSKDSKNLWVSKEGTLLLRNEKDRNQSIQVNLYLSEVLTPEDIVASYASEVEFVDRAIGQLLAKFEDRGLLENTFIILTADHGEGLGDHGEIGHLTQLYDSMVHVPLILHCPQDLPRGVEVEEPVGLVDVFPTILDALELPNRSDGHGRSLLPLIDGTDDSREKYVYLETYAPEAPVDKFGLRTAKWKFIRTPSTGEEELFHLVEDPKELNNRVGSSTDEVQSFRALLRSLGKFSRNGSSQENVSPPLDEETLQRLKSLGYVH